MIKQITIDEKVYSLRSDAFFPIFYRDNLKREFFRDMQGMEKDTPYYMTYLAYGMIRYYDSKSEEAPQVGDFDEWTESLSLLAITMASTQIIELIRSDNSKTSRSKKKNVK